MDLWKRTHDFIQLVIIHYKSSYPTIQLSTLGLGQFESVQIFERNSWFVMNPDSREIAAVNSPTGSMIVAPSMADIHLCAQFVHVRFKQMFQKKTVVCQCPQIHK